LRALKGLFLSRFPNEFIAVETKAHESRAVKGETASGGATRPLRRGFHVLSIFCDKLFGYAGNTAF